MRDIGSDVFLKALFGLGGITILIFVWVQPMATSERIFSTVIGSAGLLTGLTGLIFLRTKPTNK